MKLSCLHNIQGARQKYQQQKLADILICNLTFIC